MRKRNWPDNLYERHGYYSWRNPLTGEELGIGTVTEAEAKSQALEANLHIQELLKKPRLVDRLSGRGERTIEKLVEAHDGKEGKENKHTGKLGEKLKNGELSEATVKNLRSCGRAVARIWQGRIVEGITTLEVADLLRRWKIVEQLRMAKSIQSYLKAYLFRYAEAEGWIPRGSNPATITDKIKPKVKRARLTLEQFQVIYEAAGEEDAWVQNSMALGIVSLQRREDLFMAEFRQRDEKSIAWCAERMLWVAQQKVEESSGMRLRIPYELELRALGWSLEWAISRCRRDNVVSRWLIHHSANYTKCKPGDQVWLDTITKGFRRARDRSGLRWPEGLKPPTFHEIRSLGGRLYEQQGNVDVQALFGHTNPDTTKIYLDPRDQREWVDLKIA